MQMVNDGVTPYLSEDILTNILKRLPVKSLIRFQCVCKHWKNLIKRPYFVADHLHHSSLQNPSLLFERDFGADPLQLCLLDCGMQVREVQNVPSMGSSRVSIIGSSNGLVCVEFDDCGKFPWSLLLWNPARREVRQVPRTVHDCRGEHRLGFGFSPFVNDYKILRACAKFNDVVNRVEVYSLNTGLWKEINLGNIEGVRILPDPVTRLPKTVTVNGAMFWFGLKPVAEEGEGSIHLIVSFDIALEAFILIPMPNLGFDIKCDCYLGGNPMLMVYENKLAILWDMMIGEFDSFFVSLWVMEEGIGPSGERCSWTKKYTSRPFLCSITPVAIWRDEIVSIVSYIHESFISVGCEGETIFSLFNINTGQFKWFAIRNHGLGQYISNFTESLIPVGNVCTEEP